MKSRYRSSRRRRGRSRDFRKKWRNAGRRVEKNKPGVQSLPSVDSNDKGNTSTPLGPVFSPPLTGLQCVVRALSAQPPGLRKWLKECADVSGGGSFHDTGVGPVVLFPLRSFRPALCLHSPFCKYVVCKQTGPLHRLPTLGS